MIGYIVNVVFIPLFAVSAVL